MSLGCISRLATRTKKRGPKKRAPMLVGPDDVADVLAEEALDARVLVEAVDVHLLDPPRLAVVGGAVKGGISLLIS